MTGKGPQLENGFTRIANEVLEALMRTNLNAYQTRIIFAIWRKTYGWKKKEDWIANKIFVELTGLKKSHVSRAIKELKERKIVTSSGNKIAFNKEYTQWRELPRQVTPKKVTSLGNGITSSGNKVTSLGNKKLPDQGNTKEKKETLTKETLTKESAFAQFWIAYPKKRSKGQAEKAWKKLKINEELFNQIMAGLERAKQSREWAKEGGQFIPHPATWLNSKGWEDEYETRQTTGNRLHDKILEVGASWLQKTETDS